MSIERAEQLKREWTDKYVTVQNGVPELRRFEGLTGQVKTVNMNCRLLIQFDTPADISWYDIAPRFLNVVDPEQQKPAMAAQEDIAGSGVNQKPTTASPELNAGSGKPLDQIREQATGGAGKTATEGTAVNPLDAIRKQSGGSAGKASTESAAASPLDAIRKQNKVSSQSDSPTTDAHVSPPDTIRQQSTGSTPPAKVPEEKAGGAAGTPAVSSAGSSESPLDQIRAQSSRSATESGARPTETAPQSSSEVEERVTESDVGEGSPLDRIRAQAAAVSSGSAVADLNAETVPTAEDSSGVIAADAANSEEHSNEGSDAAAAPTPDSSGADGPLAGVAHQKPKAGGATKSPSTAPTDGIAHLQESSSNDVNTVTGSPMDQIREQAAGKTADSTSSDSHFEQVRQQAAAEHSTDPAPAGLMSTDIAFDGSKSSNSHSASAAGADSAGVSETASDLDHSTATTGEENDRRPATQQTLFDQPDEVKNAETAKGADWATADAGGCDSEGAKQEVIDSTTEASGSQFAGIEDPVKATYRGKKLPKKDDLKIVEGIGPKIAQLFNDDGIMTWKQLAEAAPERLRKILDDAGPRFRMHNPETWPAQAKLADAGKWQELEDYQDHLDGGREPGKD